MGAITEAETEGAPAEGAARRGFYRWELDLIRVAAFLLVFCQHALPQHGGTDGRPNDFQTTVSYAGGFGVSPLLRPIRVSPDTATPDRVRRSGTIAVKSFYLRRTLRIWPLYFLFVLLCIPFVSGGIFLLPGIEPGHLVPTLTFTLNWWQGLDPPSTTSLSGILWSLAVEEQMYLVWPLLMIWLLRRGYLREGLIVLGILGVVSRIVIAALGLKFPAIWVLTPTAFDSFALGGLLALFSERSTFALPRWSRPVLMTGSLAALLAMTWIVGIDIYSSWTSVWSYLAVNVLCVVALLAARGDSARSVDAPRSFVSRALVWGGRRSYGLYVWHRVAIAAVVASFSSAHVNELRLVPLALALTVLTAWMSYSAVERPFLRLKGTLARVASAPV